MRDYAKMVALFRAFGVECADPDCCRDCQFSGFCESGFVPEEIADAIEELLAVCRDIASFVIHYSDEDNVSAEVLCRKLHKIGAIEKDGAWWTLPDPPKEDANENHS